MATIRGFWQRHYNEIISVAVLIVICAVAFFLRTYFAEKTVVRDGVTYFKENDPYYHVRLVENLLRHFPERISFDPYTYFPNGQTVFFAPLFDLMLGFTIWVIGLGSPTPELIRSVSLYFPAVMGALAAAPVYLIGRELFNRKAGLAAALVLSFTPNNFFVRSVMGFTDHHVLEVLLCSFMFYFLIMALKHGEAAGFTFAALKDNKFRSFLSQAVYTALFGLCLGLYILAWSGGLLLVFTLFLVFVVIYLLDYFRGKPVEHLVATGVTAFSLAIAVILPYYRQVYLVNLCLLSLGACAVITPGMYLVSRVMDGRRIPRAWYLPALFALGGLGVLGFYIVWPAAFVFALSRFRLFTAETNDLTIGEARPLLYARGTLSLIPALEELRAGLILAPLGLILFVREALKKITSAAWLFIVWCAVMTAATLGQIRFTYYLIVNVSLLSGYFLVRMGGLIHNVAERVLLKRYRRDVAAAASEERRRARPARTKKQPPVDVAGTEPVIASPRKPRSPLYVSSAVMAVVSVALVIVFAYPQAAAMAATSTGPTADWHEALTWLRYNTPEPFGDPEFYYSTYERPASGTAYPYPPSAYGVMSWWDYGHWITQIAHRIPNTNPHQAGAKIAAQFFIAQDEDAGAQILNETGSRYVVIDQEMAIPYRIRGDSIQFRKFFSMATWAGENPDRYFEDYYRQENGTLAPVPLYYPEYYQSMVARMFVFNGQARTPNNSTVVISYAERSGRKEIISEQTFRTYQQAKEFLANQTGSNWRIVGKSPLMTPVPLAKLKHFERVHSSPTAAIKIGDKAVAGQVEIFSYKP